MHIYGEKIDVRKGGKIREIEYLNTDFFMVKHASFLLRLRKISVKWHCELNVAKRQEEEKIMR
jgi:hypothetical protein